MPAVRVWGPWALAVGLFLALMLSFLSVVQQGVARAEQQQRLAGELGRAELRCQAEGSYARRQACVTDLKAATALASLR